MTGVRRVKHEVVMLDNNIDGASWAYEGRFLSGTLPTFEVERILVGNPPLSDGVVLGLEWQIKNEKLLQAEYVFSFTRANSPSQIYHIPIGEKVAAERLSSEKVLGIPDEYLSAGEDASYTSFDGLRVSARLYLPSSNSATRVRDLQSSMSMGVLRDRRGQILPGSQCRSFNI